MIYVRLLLVCLFTWPVFAGDTLQQISAEALSSNPSIALSTSGRFVTIQDSKGVSWLRESSSDSGKQLGQQSAAKVSFSWSPDDKYVYLTSGGRAVSYRVPSGKKWNELSGDAPISLLEVSPNGKYSAFIRNNNLWVAASEDGKLKPLTQVAGANVLAGIPDEIYGREFAVSRHYWWSPDSSSIAFIETEFQSDDHYPVAGAKLPMFRLKTADVKTGETRVVSESSEEWPYLLRVAWHPDSKSIAFYRMNRLQTVADLCLADNVGIKTVLSERDAYWINAPETPVFVGEGKQIVVSSERSGHRHIYLYELSGELVRDLTPGDLEVYRLHEATDRKGVFVSGSLGNRQEQQLFRVDLAGDPAKPITGEAGWHDVSLTPSGNAYLDSYSTATKPTSVWLHRGTGRREIVPSEVSQKAVANELLPLFTHDKVPLAARLFKPDDFDPQKKYPVILYTFSGPKGRVVADNWDGWQMAWNRYMVSKGFLVLAVDVRGSGGYGHLFEEYIHYRFGAQEIADLREVASYLGRQSYVDAARLGIWGCDYGAHTVVHAMLEFPTGFKAGIADSPITDWTIDDAYFAERYLGLPAKRVNEYRDSTAFEGARRMTGSLLVVASDQNPWIRAGHLAALERAFDRVRTNKEAIKRRFHVLRLADVDYREHPDELAKLMERMTEFFISTL